MLNATHKDLIKKMIRLHSFTDVLDCLIEEATDEGLSNFKLGNESKAEDLYEIEETLCAAKTKIKQHDKPTATESNYNIVIQQDGGAQNPPEDGLKD